MMSVEGGENEAEMLWPRPVAMDSEDEDSTTQESRYNPDQEPRERISGALAEDLYRKSKALVSAGSTVEAALAETGLPVSTYWRKKQTDPDAVESRYKKNKRTPEQMQLIYRRALAAIEDGQQITAVLQRERLTPGRFAQWRRKYVKERDRNVLPTAASHRRPVELKRMVFSDDEVTPHHENQPLESITVPHRNSNRVAIVVTNRGNIGATLQEIFGEDSNQ